MTREAYEEAISLYKDLENQTRAAEQKVKEAWDELERARIEELESILKERGLAICSDSHYPIGETAEEEELGIFPLSKMSLLYRDSHDLRGSEYSEHIRRENALRLLCPDHFPENPNFVKLSEYEEGKIDIQSEVLEVDGKRVTLINLIEIDDIPVIRFLSEAIYEHFELPPLPDRP